MPLTAGCAHVHVHVHVCDVVNYRCVSSLNSQRWGASADLRFRRGPVLLCAEPIIALLHCGLNHTHIMLQLVVRQASRRPLLFGPPLRANARAAFLSTSEAGLRLEKLKQEKAKRTSLKPLKTKQTGIDVLHDPLWNKGKMNHRAISHHSFCCSTPSAAAARDIAFHNRLSLTQYI